MNYNERMRMLNVTLPRGYWCAGLPCGIKKTQKNDLGLIFSEVPAAAAAVYTTNRVQAAPLKVDQRHLRNGRARAIIVNSGCANACTGTRGLKNAQEMCRLTAAALGIGPHDVAVASTGVIGVPLPMDKITAGIRTLTQRPLTADLDAFTQAIMTTDTFPKQASAVCVINGKKVTITGTAKGSGMIAPNMATLLGFIITDASINRRLLAAALKTATERSFNMVTVDGDTSTNDMVLALANGAASSRPITTTGKNFRAFQQALDTVCQTLAKLIARDGEGATKLVTVTVDRARTFAAARQVAMSIANSNLVKTAIFGRDPNWGRIICAAGYSGVPVVENKMSLKVQGLKLFTKGLPLPFDKPRAIKLLGKPDVSIILDLNMGKVSATAWTCDFTYDYVKINAEYTT
jgi:glutamate N-acetyltransferase/amino-acid N-acetyltransferase